MRASTKCPIRHLAITGTVTAAWMPLISSGSDMRATPPSRRMSAGTRSSAITAQAPASSAILACSGVTTSMIEPPFSISARPALTLKDPLRTPLPWDSDIVGRILPSGPFGYRVLIALPLDAGRGAAAGSRLQPVLRHTATDPPAAGRLPSQPPGASWRDAGLQRLGGPADAGHPGRRDPVRAPSPRPGL